MYPRLASGRLILLHWLTTWKHLQGASVTEKQTPGT
jgi:hypothetical protein